MPVLTVDHDAMVELIGECDAPHRDGTLRVWLRWVFSPVRCDRG